MLIIQKFLEDSTLTFKINGLMDYSTVDQFTPELPENITKVIVDFSNLDFIDSTGIGAVLSIIFESSERSILVEFEGLNAVVENLFETVGVFQVKKTLLKGGKE